MAKRYVDSNVFFYAKILDGVYGQSCSSIMRMIASDELKTSTSVLVPIEVANAMRKYGLSKDVAAEIRAIFSLGIEVYGIEASDAQEAAEIFSDAKISPYDCLHAAVMKRMGLNEIISADKEFDKLSWITRIDPKSMGK
jgi:predicted nucleic acid-binding protein